MRVPSSNRVPNSCSDFLSSYTQRFIKAPSLHDRFHYTTTTMSAPTTPVKIVLYRGSDEPAHFVWSPFVNKVHFRLGISSIPYTCAIGAPALAPRGKIPYIDIESPEQPTIQLGDSTLIIQSLIERGLIHDLNKVLTPAQRGMDLAVRALLEDKLYFYQGHERWMENYEVMRDHTLSGIPLPKRLAVGEHVQSEIVKKLNYHGAGGFSDSEKHSTIREIWSGLAGLLEDAKAKAEDGECFWVLGGKEPTEADATLFGFAVSVLVCEAGPKSAELVRQEFDVVVEYVERVCGKWFKEYKKPV